MNLLGLPVPLHVRTLQHHEEVRRELALMALDAGSAPARLLSLAVELRRRFAHFLEPGHAVLDAVIARGEPVVDLHYEVPADVAGSAVELRALLDEVDGYARAGRLLVLATPPDAAAYRRWFLGEFVDQITGADPTPWSEAQLERLEHGGAP